MQQPDQSVGSTAAALEGMDGLFSPFALVPPESLRIDSESPRIDSESPRIDSESPRIDSESPRIDSEVPMELIGSEEAARRLGISSRAVLKRLQKGALKGTRVTKSGRNEWQIFWSAAPEPDSTSAEPIATGSEAALEIWDLDTDPLTVRSEPIHAADSFKSVELESMRAKLEAATYRIGYLEAKLEERQREISMLTDSQQKSKSAWWQRITALFRSE